jgi:hypothetical protein
MQTLLTDGIFAIVVGIPNALVLMLLLNTWGLNAQGQQLDEEARARRLKNLTDSARRARNCMIFVIGAAAFYLGISLGKGHLDPTSVQLSLEGLLGAILPLIVWLWFAAQARKLAPAQA